MVCHHTIQNGGYMFLIVYLWLVIINNSVSVTPYTIQEFCSGNLYVHSIEPDDPYILNLKSDPTSTKISKWYQKSKRKCIKEFKTSDPSSHFVVYISDMNIPSCPDCRCNYFEISVLSSTKRYCGHRKQDFFSSESDKLSVEFHHGTSQAFDVNLTFVVERNTYIITGSPTEKTYGSGHFIETPYFPIPYTPNYRSEYILHANSNSYISVVFLDFLISDQSYIEFIGNNGTHPTRFYGSTFRPPAIVSQSDTLNVKFVSSNHPGMPGFRALCSFVMSTDHLSVPYTDCGSRRDGLSGVLQVNIHDGYGLYDCVWYIATSFTPLTTSYVSVNIWLKRIGPKSFLEFRAGQNSKSDIIKNINCENNACENLITEVTLPAFSDLYIRFVGYLESSYSAISMSYSTYHLGNCSNNEFLCEDGRCLISKFRCDGVPQCPSGTDEQECLTTETPAIPVLHPDVKTDASIGDNLHKKFLLVLVFGSFGMIAVICVAVFILMCRYEKDPPEPVDGEPQQVLGEMTGSQSTLHSSNRFDNDDLPSYDAFVKAADSYPPLFYTRSERCIQCTNFNGDARVGIHSDTSANIQSSETDLFAANARETLHLQQGCSTSYNIEVYSPPSFKVSNHIKKSNSLDSKLDNMKHDTCHLFLSIVHPCKHTSCWKPVHSQTLPANYKMTPLRTEKGCTARKHSSVWPVPDSNGNYTKDRGFTWSFTPKSSGSPDVFTVVKARCCSDSCKNISVHYSVY